MNDHNSKEIKRLFETSPFITDLDLRLESFSAGECKTSLKLREKHQQQDGYVHAGVLATVADHTGGAAAVTLIEPGRFVLTAEFRLSLLRGAAGSLLTCHARVLKHGRTLSVVESEVFCGTGTSTRLVAKATVTVAVVRPR
jgi:uncharacterized protein (TIGR00369 family)